MGTSVVFGMFSRNVMYSLLVPGLMLNIYCIYARTLKLRQFEANIIPKYE